MGPEGLGLAPAPLLAHTLFGHGHSVSWAMSMQGGRVGLVMRSSQANGSCLQL